jgi:two-component system, LytTR family, response regulator LytT
MILRIGICDDTQTDIIHLEKHIKHYMASYNIEFEIESFRSGATLLQAQKEQTFHILLLDIEMPEINGMMIARYLRDELYDDVFIVFVTSYPQYMQESFDVQPFLFLYN